jgi:hypothetical protein
MLLHSAVLVLLDLQETIKINESKKRIVNQMWDRVCGLSIIKKIQYGFQSGISSAERRFKQFVFCSREKMHKLIFL